MNPKPGMAWTDSLREWKKSETMKPEPIRILYVEDEPFLGKIVRESLESRGFEVKLVADGQQVMPAFEQYNPDVCVLDVMLPNRDGFSLGRDIRQKDPAVPIIFLTAKNQTQDVLKGFSSGGNDYIRKPFSMEELIARIQNLLQITQPSAAPKGQDGSVPLGSYRFFPLQQELHLNGEIRKLSHRETQLLGILTARPHATVERRDILKKIWGDDSFFNSRNLDVYITRLRDYLKGDDSVEIITLKGVGYRLVW
jgi:two-component system, OmpR family, response regulator VicR